MRLLSVTILLLQIATSAAAQQPSLEGVVLRLGTNEPIANAMVVIGPSVRPAAGAIDLPPRPVTTDSSGRFSFSGVPPGSYVLFADAAGYARQTFGLRESGTATLTVAAPLPSSSVITVKAGDTIKDLVFHMTPTITVSGRILGSSGSPLPGMRTEFLPVGYDATGRKLGTLTANTETNDRGEFRAFTLEPGRYYVAARPTTPENKALFLQTYYPGVSSLDRASIIEVRPGDNFDKANFSMVSAIGVSRYKVRGRLLDQKTGQTPAGTARVLNLIPRDVQYLSAIDMFPVSALPADGAFEIPGIAPGKYWLSARLSSTSAVVPVDVVAGDVEGVLLSLAAPESISGVVRVEGREMPVSSMDKLKIQLETLRVGAFPVNMMPPSAPVASPKADGTFTLTNLFPGQYDFSISGLPLQMYVRQATFGDVDALKERLQISSGANKALQIVLGANAGQLTGTLFDRDQKPVPNAQTVLIPTQFPERRDLYRTAITDANGQFRIDSISPGPYKAFAWERLARFTYFDPAFVQEFEALGKGLNIGEGARETTTLRLIPADR